jgi:HEXXH motif-containing protein
MEYHQLDADDLTALASGPRSVSAVRELCSSQLSRHLLLLKFVSERWAADRRDLDGSIAVLAEAQRLAPQVYAELLIDPLVGAWLATTTRQLSHPERSTFPLSGELLHLGNLAAAAAIRLGLDCELTGYARQGSVTLPTLGGASLADHPDGPVRITVARGRATLRAATGATTIPEAGERWRELRRLTAAHGARKCSVTIEDGSPYRDGYHAPPSERLSAQEAGEWQDLFTDAWRLIGQFLPERAAEMTIGLRAMVPLVDDGSGAARSGTARDSIGALGLTKPRSAADFAITMVHEFQHSKLSAVLDLVPLCVRDGTARHFAPWRADARPTAGLIQGCYAFLGVADAWRGLQAAPGLAKSATGQLAMVREQVRVGLAALEDSGELTRAGKHFAAGMRAGLDRLLAVPLPDDAVDHARSSVEVRRLDWQRRHPGFVVHAR